MAGRDLYIGDPVRWIAGSVPCEGLLYDGEGEFTVVVCTAVGSVPTRRKIRVLTNLLKKNDK